MGKVLKSEEEVKKILNISDWRGLSKNKVIEFVAMMPEIDKDVMVKIVEQFPDFKEFMTSAANNISDSMSKILENDKESNSQFVGLIKEIQNIIGKFLEKDDLTSEDKKNALDTLRELAVIVFENEKMNKKHTETIMAVVAVATSVLGMLTYAVLGGKIGAKTEK